jgi:hypothetical protein
MGSSVHPGPASDANVERADVSRGEILIAHEPNAGPVSAVRNILIQFSIAELKAANLYESYAAVASPQLLEDLLSRLGPGWIPIELAFAHYEAVERVKLDSDATAALGASVGDRLTQTALVSHAKKTRDESHDLWSQVGPLHRMWRRLHEGGSLAVIKTGPKEMLLEQRGLTLNRLRHFRERQLAAITATLDAVAAQKYSCLKVEHFNPLNDETQFRIGWS